MNNNDNECFIIFCISPSIRLDCYIGPLGRPRSEYSDVTVGLSVCQVYVYSIQYHRDIRGANIYNLLKSVKKRLHRQNTQNMVMLWDGNGMVMLIRVPS